MRKFIETLKNIYKIEDLRIRILNTLGFILIYRVGSYIVLPGVDPSQIGGQAQDGVLGLINMFSGGSLARASIFALGIMPYISASIVIQLMGVAVPYFQKLQKEGESGRKKINQITRYLTIVITAGQSIGYIKSIIPPEAIVPGVGVALFTFSSLIILTAGTMFVMWLGEKITDKGIGNGISLIIMIGIIAELPGGIVQEFVTRMGINGGGPIPLIIEFVALAAVVVVTILLVQGTRKIPVQYAKRIVGNKQYGGVRQYIPLKVNAAGVMPIIFAQAIMFIPSTVASIFPESSIAVFVQNNFADYTSVAYNVTFALMIIAFTYFYTAITVNPNQMAEDMKRNGGFIPGIKPGRRTADFIDNVMSRITLPGSIFLAIVAIFPAIAIILGINSKFANFYGGTSLLIMVGVVLDTLQQIESHLLMRHYDGLMKSGRIKGRSAVGASV
ncbi:MAG: preprotein translocase subunit SecY [Sphingobacteriales bacterium]|jgi:preprotein translocase subunit SecY